MVRGIATVGRLGVRLARQCDNAQAVAQRLSALLGLKAVYYPGVAHSVELKLQALQVCKGSAVFAGLREFLEAIRATRVEADAKSAQATPQPLLSFFEGLDAAQKKMTNRPVWLAAQKDLALHGAVLVSGGRDNSAEGHLFVALRDAIVVAD